jgi:hypothetical protein
VIGPRVVADEPQAESMSVCHQCWGSPNQIIAAGVASCGVAGVPGCPSILENKRKHIRLLIALSMCVG